MSNFSRTTKIEDIISVVEGQVVYKGTTNLLYYNNKPVVITNQEELDEFKNQFEGKNLDVKDFQIAVDSENILSLDQVELGYLDEANEFKTANAVSLLENKKINPSQIFPIDLDQALNPNYQKNYEGINGRNGTSLGLMDNINKKKDFFDTMAKKVGMSRNEMINKALDGYFDAGKGGAFKTGFFVKQDLELIRDLFDAVDANDAEKINSLTKQMVAISSAQHKYAPHFKNKVDAFLREGFVVFERTIADNPEQFGFKKGTLGFLTSAESAYISASEAFTGNRVTAYKQLMIDGKVQWVEYKIDPNDAMVKDVPVSDKAEKNQYKIVSEADLPKDLKAVSLRLPQGISGADVILTTSKGVKIRGIDVKASVSAETPRAGMSLTFKQWDKIKDAVKLGGVDDFLWLDNAGFRYVNVRHLVNQDDYIEGLSKDTGLDKKTVEKQVRYIYNNEYTTPGNAENMSSRNFVLTPKQVEEIKKGKDSKYFVVAENAYPEFTDKKSLKEYKGKYYATYKYYTSPTEFEYRTTELDYANGTLTDNHISVMRPNEKGQFVETLIDDNGRPVHNNVLRIINVDESWRYNGKTYYKTFTSRAKDGKKQTQFYEIIFDENGFEKERVLVTDKTLTSSISESGVRKDTLYTSSTYYGKAQYRPLIEKDENRKDGCNIGLH